MSEFVYATDTAFVLWAPTGSVQTNHGDAWYADDPFVAANPHLFSTTPTVVRGTVDRPAPEVAPVGEHPRPKKATPARKARG